jgi:periplasmic divalent cation tolerance protein
MMAKTRATLVPELTALVKAKHSYDLPETIAAPIVGGSQAYLQWIKNSTKNSSSLA